MGIRTYKLSIPTSKEEAFQLFLKAGESLPTSSDLAGIKFGRWENTISDQESAYLEWKMYDHNYASIILKVKIEGKLTNESQAVIEVERKGQLLDPIGLYKKTLRLLMDPFLELLKVQLQTPPDISNNQ